MKHKNLFWGFFFLLAAIFVVGSQLGSFDKIGLFSILAAILLVAILISNIFELNFFGIFIPAAILYAIFEKPFHLAQISVWILILAATFASIGFGIIFHKNHADHAMWHHHGFEHTEENMDDNNPYIKVNFGASSKYLHGSCIKGGQFASSFGALEVFFDQAQLSPEGATISLDCSFGAIKLYIPKSWSVIDNLHCTLGGIDNDVRFSKPEGNSPCLTLNGIVRLGGIEIKYI
ncbi:MAG: hypothetical protein Q8873_01965 [Bacillota bacterium]|nr:hypothetical protein [Bacillota bacterium]